MTEAWLGWARCAAAKSSRLTMTPPNTAVIAGCIVGYAVSCVLSLISWALLVLVRLKLYLTGFKFICEVGKWCSAKTVVFVIAASFIFFFFYSGKVGTLKTTQWPAVQDRNSRGSSCLVKDSQALVGRLISSAAATVQNATVFLFFLSWMLIGLIIFQPVKDTFADQSIQIHHLDNVF